MSPELLELLVLLALFVLLWLIGVLVRAARQGNRRLAEHHEGGPVPFPNRPPKREAPTRPPEFRTLESPPRPTPTGYSVLDATTPRARDGARAVAPGPSGRSAGRRTAVIDFRNCSDLRRAIVLISILGPCRANDPYARSESGPS
jgi:hypothetical protein